MSYKRQKMADSNSEPPRCPCGFYGSAQTSGLCSKCYRENQQKKDQAAGGGASQAAGTSLSDQLSKAMSQVSPLTSASQGLPESSKPAASSNGASSNGASNKSTDSSGTGADADEKGDESPAEDSSSGERPSPDGADGGINNNKRDISEVTEDPDKPVQKNKKRCYKCNCKLELAIREIGRCKCEYVFCQLHRLPEQHDCVYDHKEKGRQAAREKMVSPKKHMGTSLKRIDSDGH